MAKKKGRKAKMSAKTEEAKGDSVVTSQDSSVEINDPEVENVEVSDTNDSSPQPIVAEDPKMTQSEQIEIGGVQDSVGNLSHTLGGAEPAASAVDHESEELDFNFTPEVPVLAQDQDVEKLAQAEPKVVADSALPNVETIKTEVAATSDDKGHGGAVSTKLEVIHPAETKVEEDLNDLPEVSAPTTPVPRTPGLTAVPRTPGPTVVPGTPSPSVVPSTPGPTTVPRTPENTGSLEAHEALSKEGNKVKDAIEQYNLPPLPSRSRLASDEAIKTPTALLTGSPAATQSPISPPLPARQTKKHAVPPPLHEELQSEEFRQNMALANGPPQTPPRTNKSNRVESAADMSLIVNRFRQTSHHYQRQDEQSREDLEHGKDLLRSSYSTFLESLTAKASPERPLVNVSELVGNEEDLGPLQDAEKALIKVDWAYWTQVVNDFPSVASDPEKLEREITGGIPPQIRGIIWQLIANSKSKEFEDIYLTLLETQSPQEASIRRDLKRTKFIPHDMMESLYRIMKVYSVYDPDVGYTQGMAFIATPLIMNCESEADSFGLMIRLMKSYGLRELFLPDMPGLMLLLYQFDRLFEENSPQLYNHLTRQGVRSSMYATQWFLTFFAYRFPLVFVLRIYDIVFVEGIESILRIAVNLMLKNSQQLLQLKFDKLLDFLKNELFAYYLKDSVKRRLTRISSQDDGSDEGSVLKKDITTSTKSGEEGSEISDDDYDIDAFVLDAMNDVHVTPLSLKRYAAEYEEIHELEQQKEAQYESIRIKNNQLQLEVRKLEHDYTLLNREHVEIANELIKNRLKIETLIDENRDQKSTILTLRKQLQEERRKQDLPNPDSAIPSDLRQDLERTIKRNAEVMDVNIKLQDKVNDQEKIIGLLKAGNKAGAQSFKSSKPPIANAFTKLFKNDNN